MLLHHDDLAATMQLAPALEMKLLWGVCSHNNNSMLRADMPQWFQPASTIVNRRAPPTRDLLLIMTTISSAQRRFHMAQNHLGSRVLVGRPTEGNDIINDNPL